MFEYKFDAQNNAYVYDGNLFEDLISVGVPKEHLLAMQRELIEDWIPYMESSQNADGESDECSEEKCVELSKVKSFSRGDCGESVFRNIEYIPKGNRCPDRIKNCWKSGKGNREDLIKSFRELDNPVKMYYDPESDTYRVTTDGNHRTLVAKILGADCIKADVSICHINPVVKERYIKSKRIFSKLGIKEIKKKRTSNSQKPYSYVVVFENYTVSGYSSILSEPDVDKRIQQFFAVVSRDIKVAKIVQHIPQKIRKIVCKVLREEIQQHVTCHRNDMLLIDTYRYDIYKNPKCTSTEKNM